MIKIKKSATADTRTCDVTKVSSELLLESSESHIEDVKAGMVFFGNKIKTAGQLHDITKIAYHDDFYKDFINKFDGEENQSWYRMHQEEERHHLKDPKYIQDDVNIIDILEMITDGVMAGMARSGEYRKEEIPADLLQKAFDNTITLLLKEVTVV